jgi:hypothetical protein
LLITIGFDEETVEVTGRSGDGGIDVVGVIEIEGITRLDVAVQVKKVNRNISPDKITALRGSLFPNQRGIFMTTSDFTKQAVEEANAPGKSPISLVNGEQLLDLLVEHKLGVNATNHTLYEIDPDRWPEPPSPELTTVSGRVSKQTIPVSYPLPIFAYYRGLQITGSLHSTGEVECEGVLHSSVSSAGKAVTGWKSCNGWRFWYFIDPLTGQETLLDVLRASE